MIADIYLRTAAGGIAAQQRSLERQLWVCQNYAEKKGFVCRDIYTDYGQPGFMTQFVINKTGKKGNLGKFLSKVEHFDNAPAVLLFEAWDIIEGNGFLGLAVEERLTKVNVTPISVFDAPDR